MREPEIPKVGCTQEMHFPRHIAIVVPGILYVVKQDPILLICVSSQEIMTDEDIAQNCGIQI